MTFQSEYQRIEFIFENNQGYESGDKERASNIKTEVENLVQVCSSKDTILDVRINPAAAILCKALTSCKNQSFPTSRW